MSRVQLEMGSWLYWLFFGDSTELVLETGRDHPKGWGTPGAELWWAELNSCRGRWEPGICFPSFTIRLSLPAGRGRGWPLRDQQGLTAFLLHVWALLASPPDLLASCSPVFGWGAIFPRCPLLPGWWESFLESSVCHSQERSFSSEESCV